MEATGFPHLFTPLKLNERYTLKNRIVNAPMAFALIALDPEAGEKSFRKLEAGARGGDAMVCVGELDVNFRDAVRIPLPAVDFRQTEGYAAQRVGEYARRIHAHGAIALCELCHPGAEKVPFDGTQEAVGPNEEHRPNGVHVRAMTDADMARIAEDFVVCARFVRACGFDGVCIHGGHGFLFTQFLSATYNKRTDEYGGTLENRARFPLRILREIRSAMGPEFLIELRISGTDAAEGGTGGVTPEETGRFLHMCEGVVDLAQISAGLYYDAIATHQFTSMFVPHGCNAAISAVVKRYTAMPVGVIGGINSPEQMEEILAAGQADYIALGRQSLADPELANKAAAGRTDEIRRCLRCFKCFPGSPEEGYTDLPFTSEELARHVGACTVNPRANLPFDPWTLPPARRAKTVLIVGGGPAGLQAAITASDRGHRVVLAERQDRLGGLLFFTDVDTDKPDLRAFRDLLIREVRRRPVDVRLNTPCSRALIAEVRPDAIFAAVGSEPVVPPIPGIETAAHALEAYRGAVVPGRDVIMVGGGLIGAEQGLFLARTGHRVTIVELLPRIANEAYGMYREALVREIAKADVTVLENTRCLSLGAKSVRVLLPTGEERELRGDTVLYALGLRSVPTDDIRAMAGEIPVTVLGDAIRPGKVDQCTRTGYLAAIGL